MEEEYYLEVSSDEIDKIFKNVQNKFSLANRYKADIIRLIKAGFRNPDSIISKVKSKFGIK